MTQRTRTTAPSAPSQSEAQHTGSTTARDAAAKASAAMEKMIAPALPKVSSFKTTREKLHYVADVIERQALVEKGVGFNMSDYFARSSGYQDRSGHSCGTIACIAGTAMFLETGEAMVSGRNYLRAAMELLDISFEDADELFTIEDGLASLAQITPEWAVAVIRDFADNGKVRWDAFDEEGKPT